MRRRFHFARLAVGVALVATGLAVNVRAVGASPAPGVSIGDTSTVEGDISSRELYFPVTLPAPATQPVIVTWTTTPVDATMGRPRDPGVDFGGRVSGTLKFGVLRNGFTARSKRVMLQSFGDEVQEPNETLLVTIAVVSGPYGCSRCVATGTIIDDDPAPSECAGFALEDVCPTLRVSVGDATVVEGQGGGTGSAAFVNVCLIVTLSRPPWDSYVRVPFTVTGVGGAVPVVRRVPGGDFTWANRVTGLPIGGTPYSMSGTVLFGNHQPDHYIVIKVLGDSIADPGKGVKVTLGTPTVFGAPKTVTLFKAEGQVSVVDDD